jgi:hypothetical protein
VEYENNDRKIESIYSKRIRAGKRRTYFFDVRATRANDYFLTITESRKRFNDGGYDRHKIFLYKEDFNKFIKALGDTVDYVKTDLMPDFDFDAFNHDEADGYEGDGAVAPSTETVLDNGLDKDAIEISPVTIAPVVIATTTPVTEAATTTEAEEVDKW